MFIRNFIWMPVTAMLASTITFLCQNYITIEFSLVIFTFYRYTMTIFGIKWDSVFELHIFYIRVEVEVEAMLAAPLAPSVIKIVKAEKCMRLEGQQFPPLIVSEPGILSFHQCRTQGGVRPNC